MKLFTKTYPGDYKWLEMALRSVSHFCQEEVEWIIVYEPFLGPVDTNKFKRIWGRPQGIKFVDMNKLWPEALNIGSGYNRQQWVKMNTHRIPELANAYFWNWDSDVVAKLPFTARRFIDQDSGLPILWKAELNHLIIHGYPQARKDSLCRLFGKPCAWEWMRCMPIPMHGKVLEMGSKSQVWDKSYIDLQNNYPGISEFNIIGEFADSFLNGMFKVKNSDLEGPTWGADLIQQHWSWGDFDQNAYARTMNLAPWKG